MLLHQTQLLLTPTELHFNYHRHSVILDNISKTLCPRKSYKPMYTIKKRLRKFWNVLNRMTLMN